MKIKKSLLKFKDKLKLARQRKYTITSSILDTVEKIRKINYLYNNKYFNEEWYLNNNPEIIEDQIDPLVHYVTLGVKDNLDPSPLFSTKWYLATNSDVASSKMNPLLHFLSYGIMEQRAPYDVKKKENMFNDDYFADYYLSRYIHSRLPVELFVEKIIKYDVISFDIFDTALFRKVENPVNVFDVLANEIGWFDFVNARKKCESLARINNDKKYGNREIKLHDIYELLNKYYDVDFKWEEREIQIEKNIQIVNPYIYQIYLELLKHDKKIVFTSDMYLPYSVINDLLISNGYDKFEEILLSNEYSINKGNGELQKLLVNKYKDAKIVHIGDNYHSDYEQSINVVGLDAIWNPSQHLKVRSPYLNNIAGSVLMAVLNNSMNSYSWDKDIYYTHGFKTGGVLSYGFCRFIENYAEDKNIEKILFCARDCEIIEKIYKKNFNKCKSSYLEISRFSIMTLLPEIYASDLLHRFIFKYWDKVKNTKTLEQILIDTGYDYLVASLEDNDLDKFLYACSISKSKFESFFMDHISLIKKNSEESINFAIDYFSNVIGNAKKILVTDIGWSGTCISAFKQFIHKYIDKNIIVNGCLMFGSDTKTTSSLQGLNLFKIYISSPGYNSDLLSFMFPQNPKFDVDRLHMPLEYLYTSTKPSLLSYVKINNDFKRFNNIPKNPTEILSMQKGMIDFCDKYKSYENSLDMKIDVSAYTAFIELKSMISDSQYTYNIYKNFLYDAVSLPNLDNGSNLFFSSLFPEFIKNTSKDIKYHADTKSIIFVSPELIYTGAPRSLLRVCKVAIKLGFKVIVWSMKDGPFREEFIDNGITVDIVTPHDLNNDKYLAVIKNAHLTICNTIVTDAYVRFISKHCPVIWFIREASNIPDFINNDIERRKTLETFDNIFCVSEYAAKAIGKYTNKNIHVLHNCVEDETDLATKHTSGSSDVVKFVQFGTIEYRKGYDLLIAAYKSMPSKYQMASEVYFAGGFINSGTAYASYVFSEMKDIPNIHYLGIIKGEQSKITTLSNMDVVVVASRDESCSLVALEGAMLSKPLIVTENVGAKYLVNEKCGLIVQNDNVEELRYAMMEMIDNKSQLAKMGMNARFAYESKASMNSHTMDLEKIFNLNFGAFITSHPHVIVSLTSHPNRMPFVDRCVKTLINQTYQNMEVHLWLSKDQFPNKEKDLPKELINIRKECDKFEILWVEGDLKPHKKYFYEMQKNPNLPIIITDDDVIYDSNMVLELMNSYKLHPKCVSCHRANLIMFKPNGHLRSYDNWLMDFKMLKNVPTYQLLPTGVGGVLYPPHSIDESSLDEDIINDICLYTDDLWLKFNSTMNGYPTVLVLNQCIPVNIEGSQEEALWKLNVSKSNNDKSMEQIIDYFNKFNNKGDEILSLIRKDRFA